MHSTVLARDGGSVKSPEIGGSGDWLCMLFRQIAATGNRTLPAPSAALLTDAANILDRLGRVRCDALPRACYDEIVMAAEEAAQLSIRWCQMPNCSGFDRLCAALLIDAATETLKGLVPASVCDN